MTTETKEKGKSKHIKKHRKEEAKILLFIKMISCGLCLSTTLALSMMCHA
jgi:hypothetical protein